jgi:hypothetical protein
MPPEINPFEPWRPRGAGGSSGGEEMYPWRTPSQDQGAPDDDDRNVPYYRRREGKGADLDEDRPVPPPTGANAFSVLLLIVLVISTLVAAGINGGGHFWRFAACAVALWFGFFTGTSLMYRFGWLSRVGTVLAGVVLAVACFMFLPTTGGLSWWEARNRLVGLETLPPGNLDTFQAGIQGRSQVLREFPAWKKDLNTAETRWTQRTALKVVADANKLSKSDARKAMTQIEAAERALSATTSGNYRMELNTAWGNARDARVQEIDNAAKALGDKSRYIEAHRLVKAQGAELEQQVAARAGGGNVTEQLVRVRAELFEKQLQEGQNLLKALLEQKRYKAVQGEGRRLAADLREVGADLGRKDEGSSRLLEFRRDALEKRITVLEASVQALRKLNDLPKASKAITEGLAELNEEATDIHMLGRLRGVSDSLRANVVSARIAQATKAAEDLIDKKDYAAVPAKADAIQKELLAEVTVAEKQLELKSRLEAIRARAWRARLDLAREALRGLLVKDAFGEVGPLGDKTAKELAGEAAVVGLKTELAEFTDNCWAIAKLAAAAARKE